MILKVERDIKVGKIDGREGARKKKEILDALRKLGETLTNDEEIYLRQYSDSGNVNFAKMSDLSGKQVCYRLNNYLYIYFIFIDIALSAVAAKQIENARNPR